MSLPKAVVFEAHRPEQAGLIDSLLWRGYRVHAHSQVITEDLKRLSQDKRVQIRLGVREHAALQMATRIFA